MWNRNKMEFNIKVVDIDNSTHCLKVQVDVTPEQILQQLNIKDAYLIMDGLVITPKLLFKSIRENSTFYACRVQDKGWSEW